MDITNQIVERYLKALGADKYRLQLVPSMESVGRPMGGTVSMEDMLVRVAWLKLKNMEGYHIYCRPIGYEYVLIDDLTPEALPRAKELNPCIIMETSPSNYQAWLRLATAPPSRNDALAICRELAERLGADKGSAEPDHVGRLAGFTNRKDKYKRGNVYPFVRLLHSKSVLTSFSPVGGVCLKEVPPTANEVPPQVPPTYRHEVPPFQNGYIPKDTHAHAPQANHGNSGNDRSRADFNLVCMLIRQGKTDTYIRERLEATSEKAQGRRDDYIGRTIANARRIVGSK